MTDLDAERVADEFAGWTGDLADLPEPFGEALPRFLTEFCFGDFYSYVSGDLYKCMISARGTENSATTNATVEGMISVTTSFASAAVATYVADVKARRFPDPTIHAY